MSDLERVVGACESLTQTFEQQASNINAALVNQEKRIGDKEKEVDNFLAEANPELKIVKRIFIGGSKDYLYPVWFKFPQEGGKLKIWRFYSWNSDTRPINTDYPHQNALLAEIEGGSTPWSGNPEFMQFKRFEENYNKCMSHASFRLYCKNTKHDPNLPLYGGGEDGLIGPYCYQFSGFYLRGGGLHYEFISNWNIDLNFSDKHETIIIDEGTVSDSAGSFKWTVGPIPFTDLISPQGSVVPYDSLLALKV